MGMFDYVRCKYPRPAPEVQDQLFQTKDTPEPGMVTWVIGADATLAPESEPPEGIPVWGLDEAVRCHLAWNSIVEESEGDEPQLNLDATRLRLELDNVPLWRGEYVPVKQLAEEIVQHLTLQPGASVEVTLEIQAQMPEGAPDNVVRIVTENARTLKFTAQGFERD